MAGETPVIQVLDKEHYFTQAVVPLPNELPYLTLAPSSIRLRTKVLSLTVNNMTYCKLGFLLGWWDVHPLPLTTPAPYNNSAKYGRTNCWGFAEVLESTVSSVPRGSLLWGYHPIATLAQDLEVKDASVPGQVLVTSAHRQHIMPIYNRYSVYPPSASTSLSADIEAHKDGPALDAIVRVMYETAYLINRFAFNPDPTLTVRPSAAPSQPEWTSPHADLRDATVINLAPGSKAALCFAHELRHRGQTSSAVGSLRSVKRVIGATSEFSRPFVQETGFYDGVLSTSEEDPLNALARLGVDFTAGKVVLVDFGGRACVGDRWAAAIQTACAEFVYVKCGSEIAELSQQDVLKTFGAGSTITGTTVSVNASDLRDGAIERVGERKYFEDLSVAWEQGLKKGGIPGFEVQWGDGMGDVAKAWERLSKGEVKPQEGLVFKL